jgi:vacuolar protein sorting-associated protein 52
VFELGDRGAVLAGMDAAPLIPHIAEAEGRKLPYELVFRNVHKLLADTASAEYFFSLDFFEDESVFREVRGSPILELKG